MSVSQFLGIASNNISLINGIAYSNISQIKGIARTAGAAADPQLQFFENFPGKNADLFRARSNDIVSIHAVNIPLSISFGAPILLMSLPNSSGSATAIFGLYSMNASTLSLANSASGEISISGINWISLATSATQNITPGTWYLAMGFNSSSVSNMSMWCGNSYNALNAQPTFIAGRMTATTGAMPASIATSTIDTAGSDAYRQPYVIISA